jgi:hypothetical protein
MATREEFRAAKERAGARRARGPVATAARYDRRAGRIVVSLDSGVEISFAPAKAEGLGTASAAELDAIEITPSGLGLHFPKLDADLYLPALLDGLLGTRRWMAAQLGEAGGKVHSAAKAAASRDNGRLGGRPKKAVAASGRAMRSVLVTDVPAGHSQVFNPKTRGWTKRDAETGKFMDRKADAKPFKGVRKEK